MGQVGIFRSGEKNARVVAVEVTSSFKRKNYRATEWFLHMRVVTAIQ